MSIMTRITRAGLRRLAPAVALGVTAGVHLATQLWQPSGLVADVTQVMLMPLLAWSLLAWTRSAPSTAAASAAAAHGPSTTAVHGPSTAAAHGPGSAAVHDREGDARAGLSLDRLARWVLAALFFSWLGDTLPRFLEGDTAFLTLVGCFLVAQVVYIRAFWPYRRSSVGTRPVLLVPYLGLFAVLLILCAPHAGSLLVPVILYGAALVSMAVLSTGLGRVAGAGGALFFLSDGLIAVRQLAGISVPAHDAAIMSTYILAQVLLVAAVVSPSRPALPSRG